MDGGYGHQGYNRRQDHPQPPNQSSTHPYGMMNGGRNTGQSPQPTMQPQPPFYTGPPQYGLGIYQLPQGQPAFQPQMLPGPALYTGGHYGDMHYNQSMNGYGPQHLYYYGQPPPPFFATPPSPAIMESGRYPSSMQGNNIPDRTRTYTSSVVGRRHQARARHDLQDFLSGTVPQPPKATKVCMVCFEESNQFAYSCTKCCTQVCGDCIKGWFIGACKDESKMPPKCCSEIPVASVSQHISTAETELYKAKYEEWSTPNKIYCPVPTCSTFIPPKLYTTAAPGFVHPNNFSAFAPQQKPQMAVVSTPTSATQRRVSCPKCDTSICTNCRSMSHLGDCPKSDLDPKLEAQLNRWKVKRCPKCRAGVRKIAGCSHIKCRCGGEFCFSCLNPFLLCGGNCEYLLSEAGTLQPRDGSHALRRLNYDTLEAAQDDDLDSSDALNNAARCRHDYRPWRLPSLPGSAIPPRLECHICSRPGLRQGDSETDNNVAWSCSRCMSIACGSCRREWSHIFS